MGDRKGEKGLRLALTTTEREIDAAPFRARSGISQRRRYFEMV
jgi:hypothetical protein